MSDDKVALCLLIDPTFTLTAEPPAVQATWIPPHRLSLRLKIPVIGVDSTFLA